jgi:hypothetical protein
MRSLSRIVLFFLVLMTVGGAVFLATWDIPAPITKIEKVIPDDRFPR